MKVKQKLLIASALSCAAVAVVGYFAKKNNKEEKNVQLDTASELNSQTDDIRATNAKE